MNIARLYFLNSLAPKCGYMTKFFANELRVEVIYAIILREKINILCDIISIF